MTKTTDAINNFLDAATMAFARRQGERMRAAGIEIPEIKGVRFKQSKRQHLAMRNSVSRVVMVGFDPFNHSGLPEHIERQVVHDYWSGLEMQFVQDWVNEAPEGELRIGSLLNLYGDDQSYKPFPEEAMDTIRRGFQWDEAQIQADSVCRQIAENLGLPEHLMKPTLTFPSHANEVCYNGVKLSDIEIPESLNKTRDLVIELTKQVSVEDYPNLLTLFVGRGGNIRDLSDFFMLVKDAAPMPIRREPPVRSREDERGHEQYLRDSVRGLFPYMELEQTGPDLTEVESDNPIFRNNLCPEVQTLEGEVIHPVTGAFAVGADGVKRDLRDIDFMSVLLGLPEVKPAEKGVVIEVISDKPGDSADLWPPIDIIMSQQAIDKRMVRKEEIIFAFAGHSYKQTVFLSPEDVTGLCELYIPTTERRPNPLREHWEKHGDPYEGRIPHIAAFAELTKLTSQSGRNETLAIMLGDLDVADTYPKTIEMPRELCTPEQIEAHDKAQCEREPEELTPEEIADREQAIQEASEGKLDYLLEGTQWDPNLRKS